MILTCPTCNTRYQVDDAALADPAGRELRCANCGHRWRYVPASDKPTEPAASAPAPESAASTPVPVLAPTPERPPPMPAAVPPRVARGSRAGVGCLVLVVIIAAVIATLVLARNTIIRAWPPSARIYGTVGLRPAPLGAGLEISKVAPSRNGDVLVVEGDIANTTGDERTVPRLRVLLRDAAGKELAGRIIDPPTSTLAPGATTRFRTQFEHPSDAATGVAVTFTASQ